MPGLHRRPRPRLRGGRQYPRAAPRTARRASSPPRPCGAIEQALHAELHHASATRAAPTTASARPSPPGSIPGRACSSRAACCRRRAGTATSGAARSGSSPSSCCVGMVGVIADGPDEVRKAAREQIRHDVDQIKIMASGRRHVARRRARHHAVHGRTRCAPRSRKPRAVGKYVLAHAYSGTAVPQRRRAPASGRIEHGNLDRRRRRQAIKKAGAFLVPTMVTYEAIWREGKSYGDRRPPDPEDQHGPRARASRGLSHAYRAGCKIGSGSDLLGDMQSQRSVEFELKGQVMKPMEVPVSATRVNAELFRMEARDRHRRSPASTPTSSCSRAIRSKDLPRVPEPGQPPPDHEGRRRLQARRRRPGPGRARGQRKGAGDREARAGDAHAAARHRPRQTRRRPPAADFEKLGVFYLGRALRPRRRRRPEEGLLLYDFEGSGHARRLRRHDRQRQRPASAWRCWKRRRIDGIPALLVDRPQGRSRKPDAHVPRSAGGRLPGRGSTRTTRGARVVSTDALRATAGRDRGPKGLAAWGEDGARIRRLPRGGGLRHLSRRAARPGSAVSVLASFARRRRRCAERTPRLLRRADRQRGDEPARAGRRRGRPGEEPRAHPGVHDSSDAAWRAGGDLDLAGLAHRADPDAAGRRGSGVLDRGVASIRRETRFALAMAPEQPRSRRARLRAVDERRGARRQRASLRTQAGKPRVSIFSIAHLGDAERMFFVSLLLNQIARAGCARQSGTHEPARPRLHGRDLRLLPAGRRIRRRSCRCSRCSSRRARSASASCWRRRTRSTSTTRVCRTPAPGSSGDLQTERDKARLLDGARGRRPAGQALRSRQDGGDHRRPRQPRLPDEQRPRGRTRCVFETRWAHVVPARAAHARPDQDLDGRAARRTRVARPRRRRAAPSVPAARPAAPTASAVGRALAAVRPVLPPDIRSSTFPARRPGRGASSISRTCSARRRCASPTPSARST